MFSLQNFNKSFIPIPQFRMCVYSQPTGSPPTQDQKSHDETQSTDENIMTRNASKINLKIQYSTYLAGDATTVGAAAT